MRNINRNSVQIISIFTAIILICNLFFISPVYASAYNNQNSSQSIDLPAGGHMHNPVTTYRKTEESDYTPRARSRGSTRNTNFAGNYYYNQLDNQIKKDLYIGMYNAAASDKRIPYGGSLPDENDEAAVQQKAYLFYTDTNSRHAYYLDKTKQVDTVCTEATEALCYDYKSHVEYYMCKCIIYEFTSNNEYRGYIIMQATTNDIYETLNTEITNQVSAHVTNIRSQGLVDSEKPAVTILNVHDYFVKQLRYDHNCASKDENGYFDYAHTAYGSLCRNVAVCDGYSLGYALILEALGITSRIVTGYAITPSSSGGHAWNMVEIEGDWYEEDTTWDDSGYYANHNYFNKTTSEYTSGILGAKHLRQEPFGGILINKAYGTKYTYSYCRTLVKGVLIDDFSLKVGESKEIQPTLYPAGASYDLIYGVFDPDEPPTTRETPSGSKYATLSGNVITGVKNGRTQLVVAIQEPGLTTNYELIYDTCYVTVYGGEVNSGNNGNNGNDGTNPPSDTGNSSSQNDSSTTPSDNGDSSSQNDNSANPSEPSSDTGNSASQNDASAKPTEPSVPTDSTDPAKALAAFNESSNLIYTINGDSASISKASSNASGKLTIPDTITIAGSEYPVTSIEPEAFLGNKNIKEVRLGSNIQKIGYAAFKNCKKLKVIDMSRANVTSIDDKAFYGCRKLKKLKINGNALKNVGSKACKKLPSKLKVIIYAANKKTFNEVVDMLKDAGLKTEKIKFKKRH